MKPLAHTKLLALVASCSAFALFALQACSGDNNNAGDGGPDGTANDVATDTSNNKDVTQQEGGGSCPSYSGSVPFCKGAVTRCNTCGAGSVNFDTCTLANLDAVCNWANGVFSQQYQNAFESCATTCDQDAESACTKAAVADASLTSAQQKMVDDYCARCGPSQQNCAANTAQKLQVVVLSDPLAGQVDTACTPDAGGPDSSACGLGYVACYSNAVQNALGGNPCADAGGQ